VNDKTQELELKRDGEAGPNFQFGVYFTPSFRTRVAGDGLDAR